MTRNHGPGAPLILGLFGMLLGSACAPPPASLSPEPRGISVGAATNAASFLPPELPGGSIAQGSLFTLFGSDMGPALGVSTPAFPLPTSLAGVTIEVSGAGGTVNAIPVFVRSDQINAIMPSNSSLGPVTITVVFNGERSAPFAATIVPSAIGIFTQNGSGSGPGSITNFVSQTNQPLNGPEISAAPDDFVTFWVTGVGGVNAPDNMPPVDVGAVGTLRPVMVVVGGRPISNVAYAGRSSQFPGLDQVVVELDDDLVEGCSVPVVLEADGVASNTVSMAIRQNRGQCSDPANPLLAYAGQAGRFGLVTLLRGAITFDDQLLASSLSLQSADDVGKDPLRNLLAASSGIARAALVSCPL